MPNIESDLLNQQFSMLDNSVPFYSHNKNTSVPKRPMRISILRRAFLNPILFLSGVKHQDNLEHNGSNHRKLPQVSSQLSCSCAIQDQRVLLKHSSPLLCNTFNFIPPSKKRKPPFQDPGSQGLSNIGIRNSELWQQSG